MDGTATTDHSVDAMASQVLGRMEVIANIRVRRLKKRKEVCAPPVGQKFGLNVQHLPQLGIGVNTVHYSSPLFDCIRRGDIICEFMGENLQQHKSMTGFVEMLRKQASSGTERKLVVQYTAADLINLWERVEVESAESKRQEGTVNETAQPPSNDVTSQVDATISNASNQDIQSSNGTSSKSMSCPTSKETIISQEVNDSNTKSEKLTKGHTLPETDNNGNELPYMDKNTVHNPVSIVQKNAVVPIITANASLSSKSDSISINKKSEVHVVSDKKRPSINGEDFQEWLSHKKETWKFDERVKKVHDKKLEFESAASFGLPDGWMVRIKERSRYTFRCPNGKLFYSKKKAFEYLGIDTEELRPVTVAAVEPKNNPNAIAFTRVYQSTTIEKKNLLNVAQEKTIEATYLSTSQSTNLSNGVLSKDVRSLSPVENDRSRAPILAKLSSEPKLPIEEEQQSEKSDSSVDSLSDIVTKLNDARRIVAQFGPLPWKGCRIVTVPPAPHLLGLNVQSTPGKFGIGIVTVLEKSPLYRQVKRGDIITHFMDVPLHGLKTAEVVRLLQSEVQNDRMLQIAPSGFNLNSLLIHKTDESQTGTIDSTVRDSEQKLKKSRTLTHEVSSLDSVGVHRMPSVLTNVPNFEAKISSPKPTRIIENDKNIDVVKCENVNEKEALHDANTAHDTEIASVSERKLATNNLTPQGESVSNNIVDSNSLPNDEVNDVSRTEIKVEDLGDQVPSQATVENNENRSAKRVDSYSNNSTGRIENRGNFSTQRIENLGTGSAIEEASSDIQGNERTSESLSKWTLEEDNLLRRLVTEHGADDWGRISLEVPRKTATQCRFRWINVIYPSVLLSRNQAISNITTNNEEDSSEQKIDEQANENGHKKVVLSPYDGPLGLNVQELPSKEGIGVVRVRETSPLYGKLHRGDVIVKFMEVSLRNISVLKFIEMVNEKEHEARYFLVSTHGSISPPSVQSRSVFGIPVIDLNDENSDEEEQVATFRATGMTLAAFAQEDIEKMPVCFAFDPCNIESQRIAGGKQKLWNESFQMRKKQKTQP